jgi:tRNA modification GTPase
MQLFDTIAAISTPHGKGGVALLRVSGEQALEISAKVFRPMSGKTLGEIPARYAVYGQIMAPEEDAEAPWVAVDDGIATVYRAPAFFAETVGTLPFPPSALKLIA